MKLAWILAGLVAACTLAACGSSSTPSLSPSPSSSSSAHLSVSPITVHRGNKIIITGDGFAPNASFSLGFQQGSLSSIDFSTDNQTDAQGHFVITLPAPTTFAAGATQLSACQGQTPACVTITIHLV